jgi:hypothetical protein
MPITPKISSAIKKDHQGEVAISLAGKIIGIGKNGIEALKKAKKVMPSIENEEFLVSRIQPQYIAA